MSSHSCFRGALQMMKNALGLSECQHIQPRFPASENLSHLIYLKRISLRAYWQWYGYGLVNHPQKAQAFRWNCLHWNHSSVWINNNVPGVTLHVESSGPFWFPHSSGWELSTRQAAPRLLNITVKSEPGWGKNRWGKRKRKLWREPLLVT